MQELYLGFGDGSPLAGFKFGFVPGSEPEESKDEESNNEESEDDSPLAGFKFGSVPGSEPEESNDEESNDEESNNEESGDESNSSNLGKSMPSLDLSEYYAEESADEANSSALGESMPSLQLSEYGDEANSSALGETMPSLQLLEYAKERMEGSAKEKKPQKGKKQTGKGLAAPNKVHSSVDVHASVGVRVLNELPAPDQYAIIPPIAVKKDVHGHHEFRLRLPTYASGADRQAEVTFRNPEVGLTVAEHAKVPAEFNWLPEYTLAKFWDLAYDPTVCKTALRYEWALALARRRYELEGPNKLLVMLANIQNEEEFEHVFDAGYIKIRGNHLSIAVFPKGTAKPSDTDILWAAFDEIALSLADPSYKKTAACKRLALSKGVNLDSQLMDRLTDLFLGLSQDRFPTNTPAGLKLFLEKLALIESKAFGASSDDEWSTVEESSEEESNDL